MKNKGKTEAAAETIPGESKTKEQEYKRVQKFFYKPSLTKQEFKKDANINTIMAKYEKTGKLPINQLNARYLNNTGEGFREKMQTVVMVKEAFQALPSETRRMFDNDPAKCLDFCANPENREKAEQLGLITKEEELAPKKPEMAIEKPPGEAATVTDT